jgi:hypothetical protein
MYRARLPHEIRAIRQHLIILAAGYYAQQVLGDSSRPGGGHSDYNRSVRWLKSFGMWGTREIEKAIDEASREALKLVRSLPREIRAVANLLQDTGVVTQAQVDGAMRS